MRSDFPEGKKYSSWLAMINDPSKYSRQRLVRFLCIGISLSLKNLASLIMRKPSCKSTSLTFNDNASEIRNPQPYNILRIRGNDFSLYGIWPTLPNASAAWNNRTSSSLRNLWKKAQFKKARGKKWGDQPKCSQIPHNSTDLYVFFCVYSWKRAQSPRHACCSFRPAIARR